MKFTPKLLILFLLFTSSIYAQNGAEPCILLKNDANVIPIINLGDKIASVNLCRNADVREFNSTLKKYAKIDVFDLTDSKDILQQLGRYDIVIFSIANKEVNWELLYKITSLLPQAKIIGVSFIKLDNFIYNNYIFNADTLIEYADGEKESLNNAASLIFGGVGCSGKLNADIKGHFKKGAGITIKNLIRLNYGKPEDEGLDASYIHKKVDSIMDTAIREQAFPGAQLLVAKNNTVIYHKSFGYHTFDNLQPVSNDDLYDLASVTKITGPLPVLMQLVDKGKIDVDEKFSTYWKPWSHIKDKKDLTVREILAHQAGLEPYYIFLNEILKKGHFKRRYVRTEYSKRFPVKIYKDLYLNRNFRKKMYRIIGKSKVSDVKKYKYSGMSFLIYPELIEELTGVPYENYVIDSIYKPLGAYNLMFNPSGKYPEKLIVPTELDTIYRKAYVKGWVHDENASLLGGVSGNAGLFATANDLAKLIYMYQSMGAYGGKRYISEKTLKEFTKVQYPENGNKRGLGFDKPLLNNSELDIAHASPAPEVSPESFGHGGFTGTYVWADPVNKLLFIFLSNRVYPTRTHRNLYNLNVRPSLQQVFYKASL
ncbi:serine hydrolase domain-containing protein [Galbibacter sp. PAP.153]|uniref:serine hydrolase domain-containing protein n=1 Tax=Galbibacter sp. PAP.153 TaxID=3104623 RepID=UPI00300A1E4D